MIWVLMSFSETPSQLNRCRGLGGRGQAAWRLGQRVDKDCMRKLATRSLSSSTGNRMLRAWGWHIGTLMPQVAWECARQGQHTRQCA